MGLSIRVSAFRSLPPFAQGLARDFRVRWALEEAGLPYEERLIGPEDQSTESYRALQPFGQIPAIEEDGLPLFESGAIVLHIASGRKRLMPSDPAGRARVTCWAFAALNSIEPRVQALGEIDLFHADAEWAKLRRPAVEQAAKTRLDRAGRPLQRTRLSRGPLHRRRHTDDDGVAHLAPHRPARADSAA